MGVNWLSCNILSASGGFHLQHFLKTEVCKKISSVGGGGGCCINISIINMALRIPFLYQLLSLTQNPQPEFCNCDA